MGSCLEVQRREVRRMLGSRTGMGRFWWAPRRVVLGYGGLMEREKDGSGLLETDKTPVIL